MRIAIILLALVISTPIFSQETELGLQSNLVILCGAQDVYKKSSAQTEFQKTYTWPSTTYTLFQINSVDKIFSYQQLPSAEVERALKEHSTPQSILTDLQSIVNKEHLIQYEIMDEINSNVNLSGDLINGYIYILRLPHQSTEDVNTTAELSEGKVSVSSIDAEGQPYKSVYPVLKHEVLINSK